MHISVLSNVPMLHMGPSNPLLHRHVNLLRWSLHDEPFKQGLLAHSSMSILTGNPKRMLTSLMSMCLGVMLYMKYYDNKLCQCVTWLHTQILVLRTFLLLIFYYHYYCTFIGSRVLKQSWNVVDSMLCDNMSCLHLEKKGCI